MSDKQLQGNDAQENSNKPFELKNLAQKVEEKPDNDLQDAKAGDENQSIQKVRKKRQNPTSMGQIGQMMVDQQYEEQEEKNEGWFGSRSYQFEIGTDKENKKLKITYDACSLYIFDSSNSIRKIIVKFINWKGFDGFIMAVIVLNSIMLCIYDKGDRIYGPNYYSAMNEQLDKIDLLFTTIFILECTCKIIGMGFVFHKNAYLRDPWNWLDFFVVAISVLQFMPNIKGNGTKALRTFRILRPLRTVNRLPKMKALIQTLFASISGLVGVGTFLGILFLLFAIFGIQSFAGNQYQMCRTTMEPNYEFNKTSGVLDFYEWPVVDSFPWLCQTDNDCKRLINYFGNDSSVTDSDTPVYKCGASIEFSYLYTDVNGKTRNKTILAGGLVDNPKQNSFILYDIVNFNNAAGAMLTIFQVLSLENWTDSMMYNYMDANNTYISAVYFIFLVIFGAFFIINLILAQIIQSFDKEKEKVEAEKKVSVNSETVNKRFEEIYKESLQTFESQENDINSPLKRKKTLVQQAQDNQSEEKMEEIQNDNLDDSSYEAETETEKKSRLRSHENKLYRFCFKLVTHWGFSFFITIIIILNTISLAADTYDISENGAKLLKLCNFLFTWLFTAEMILKLIGLGPKQYVKDGYNILDCVIVCISLIDFTITQAFQGGAGKAQGALKALRALRLFRIIKLLRRWTALQEILRKTALSFDDVAVFTMLLMLFMFIFSLLGMQLFGKFSYTDKDGNLVPKIEIIERYQQGDLTTVRESFDNIWISMNTVFIVIMADGWNWVMYYNIIPQGDQWGIYSLFFVILFTLGNKVMLSLFTAILLSNFDEDDVEESETVDEKDEQANEITEPKERPHIFKRIFSKENIKQSFKSLSGSFLDTFGYKMTLGEQKMLKLKDEINNQQKLQAEESKINQQIIILKDKSQLAAGPASGQKNSNSEENLGQIESPKNEQINRLNIFEELDGKREVSCEQEQQDQDSPSKFPKIVIDADVSQADSSKVLDLSYKLNKPQLLSSPIVEGDVSKDKIKKFKSIRHRGSQLMHYSMGEQESQSEKQTVLYEIEGRSLFIFTKTNCCGFRAKLLKMVSNFWFENIILFLIGVSTINLALEGPLDPPDCNKLKRLKYIDYVMTACFTIEMCSKIIVYGFLFNKSQSYLRISWNILDFVIVISALISLSPSTGKNLKVLKTLRILRVLRPLRMVSRNKGLKVSITALFKSLPDIANLQLIVTFCLFLFAILHMTLLGGTFWYCSTTHLSNVLTNHQVDTLIDSKWDCINYGGEWLNQDYNFDNVFTGMMSLFGIQSTEGWSDPVEWSEFDATSVDHAPKKLAQPANIILSWIYILISNILFLNLFVGIVVETFNKQKDQLIGTHFLTKRKMDIINIQVMGYQAKPKVKTVPKPEFSTFRNNIIRLVNHKAFEFSIMSCIIGNTIVLCIQWYGQSNLINKITNNFNYFFIAVFTLEAVLKLIAYQKNYFKETWNIFDFIVVVVTLIILIVGFTTTANFAIQATIVRSLRIGRLLKLFRSFKKLQVIFKTISEAGPSMLSLGSLLLLFLFMFAVIGMKLFGFSNIDNQSTVHYHNNFRNFLQAFVLLIRSSTGEAWDSIMFDMARKKTITFQCESSFTYDDLLMTKDNHTNKCGTGASYAYFLAYVLIVTQIFLNLFIAVIIDSFISQTEASELPVEQNDIDIFVEIWQIFDNNAEGQIKCKDLPLLIRKLGDADCQLLPKKYGLIKPFKEEWYNSLRTKEFGKSTDQYNMRRYLETLCIKVHNNWTTDNFKNEPIVFFTDVLISMIFEKYKYSFNEEAKQKRKTKFKTFEVLKSDQIGNAEKAEFIKLLKIQEQDQSLMELSAGFDSLSEGLTYEKRQIDMLHELRNKAFKRQKENLKKLNDYAKTSQRQARFDSSYQRYKEYYTQHLIKCPTPNVHSSQEIQDFNISEEKCRVQGCKMLTKQEFDEKIFCQQLTTFHFAVFNRMVVIRNVKKQKQLKMLQQEIHTDNDENAYGDAAASYRLKPQQLQQPVFSQKTNRITPSRMLQAIQEEAEKDMEKDGKVNQPDLTSLWTGRIGDQTIDGRLAMLNLNSDDDQAIIIKDDEELKREFGTSESRNVFK